MDPDAALFIKFFQDPPFWLWFGEHIQSLSHQSGDLEARPKLDRFLHGLIRADQHQGATGEVLTAMHDVLMHTPEVFTSILRQPPLNIEQCFEEVGPHSLLTSSRFLHYAFKALSEERLGSFQALLGACQPFNTDIGAMTLSAALCRPDERSVASGLGEQTKRRSIFISVVTALHTASLPGEPGITAGEIFTPSALSVLSETGFLTWPEWQLLPLLDGGVELAEALNIDLIEVSKGIPVDGVDCSITKVAFLTGHVASCKRLHDYCCNVLLPSCDPSEVIKNIWSLNTAMAAWAPGYIAKHRDVFFTAAPPSASALSALIRYGVDKRTVMSHPAFGMNEKGRIISDDLGI